MPDQVPEEVKRDRIERLIEVVQRVAAAAQCRARRRGRGGARRGAEPHRPAVLRGRTRRNTTVNFTGARPPGELVHVRDQRGHLDDAAGRAGRPRRRIVCDARPRLGRLPERPRPRRPADRGRRPDALRLGDPRRQRRPADPRRLARRCSKPASRRIVDLRDQVEIDDDPPRDLGRRGRARARARPLRRGDAGRRSRPRRSRAHRTQRRPSSSTCGSWSIAGRASWRRSRRSPRRRARSSFHCHGGKDRTGLVAALLLRLAGVPVEVDRRRLRAQPQCASSRGTTGGSPTPRTSRAGADRTDHGHARRRRCGRLDALDQRYGGVERYLLDGGLAPGGLEAARSRLR